MEEEKIIKERTEKVFNFLKSKISWIIYIILALVVFLAVRIRTSNLSKLRDVSTGAWTLGPDLDPFLFVRWAKYIVANGSLMPFDTMRYVPLGFETKGELIFLSYLIAWFHKLAAVFGSTSVEQSAAIFPAVMFGLTVIAFFLLVRKFFVGELGSTKAGIAALVSAVFLSILPSLLPRTIAGIPEKESAAFFFLFLAFYFFLVAWKSDKKKISYLFALLSSLATTAMALVWGGYIYIFITIAIATFLLFFLGQVNKEKLLIFTLWIIPSTILMGIFSTRYTIQNLALSTSTGIAYGVFAFLLFDFFIFNRFIKNKLINTKMPRLNKIPPAALSLLTFIIFGLILISIIFGPDFFIHKYKDVTNVLFNPIVDRISSTVAENKQPYFTEWAGSFGPVFKGIPLLFWLFFIGSIYLFYRLSKPLINQERILLTCSFTIFITSIIFSRYSSESTFNGTNFISKALYFSGVIILLGTAAYVYYKVHKRNENDSLKNMDASLLLLFVFFFLSIVSARGAVRTIMVLVPAVAAIASYLFISLFSDATKSKSEAGRLFFWLAWIIVLLAVCFSAYTLYNSVSSEAQNYAPYSYTHQWQYAMSWIRDNTPTDSVFGHWWDYGYWVQSIGERATVLDGGNSMPYWNHMMGRYGLTGRSNQEALEFLYAHNTTHFLIDSTDIGKYGAFSLIGSNETYDRRSWIQFFQRDDRYTNETKNTTTYFFTGSFPLDEDLVYVQDGKTIILPEGKAALAAVTMTKDKQNNIASQPKGIFLYQKTSSSGVEQYTFPLRYAYQNNKLTDFKSGVDAGIFAVPAFAEAGGQPQIERDYILMYLSSKTVQSQLARLYLYNEENQYFKLVHTEDNLFVKNLKQAGLLNENEDFVMYQGFQGPIKIWEINYPKGIEFNPKYVSTIYPPELTKL